jgi:ABC-type uncharacterized transport system permease subunit
MLAAVDWGNVIGGAAIIPLLGAAISLAVPIAVAASGECIAERSGVLNLGLEGMMLCGALGAFLATYHSGNSLFGLAVGGAAGLVLAAFVGIFVIRFKIDQVVVGVAAVILAGGITSYIYLRQFGRSTTPPTLPGLKVIDVPLLSKIPGVGTVLFQQQWTTYVGLLIPFAMWWVLARTRFGLSVRAVGEKPDAADANAVSVDAIRWMGLLIAGLMGGLGGGMLVIGDVHLFRDQITAGRGWIAIAMVIVARWNPIGALAGALLFGFTFALQNRLQTSLGGLATSFPSELFQALPYIVTFVVVTISTIRARRNPQPSALGSPFFKTS